MKFYVHRDGWQFAETWEGDNVEDIKQQWRERYGRIPKSLAIWEDDSILPGIDDPNSAMRFMM